MEMDISHPLGSNSSPPPSSLLGYRHLHPPRVDHAIAPIVAVAKVLGQQHILDRVAVARAVLGGVGAQRGPVAARVQLAVAGGVVAEGVERGAVGVAGGDLWGKGGWGVRISHSGAEGEDAGGRWGSRVSG